MTKVLQIAGGSCIGRDHRLVGRNNQDSWTVVKDAELMIGIVADGCGSGARSEVGSQLGVRLFAECIRAAYAINRTLDFNWSNLQHGVLSQLDIEL